MPARTSSHLRFSLWVRALWLTLSLCAFSVQGAEADDFFDPTFGALNEELEVAADDQKKAVFVFFEMDGCPFCHWMKQHVLNQPEVQNYFQKNFLNLSLNISREMDMTDFQGTQYSMQEFSHLLRIRATPLMLFVDLKGQVIFRFIGKTSSVQEFLWMGEYVAEGHYHQHSFIRFKQQKRASLKKS
jgi:thioredoxin-related protein